MSTTTESQANEPATGRTDSPAPEPEGLRDMLNHIAQATTQALHAPTAVLTLLHDGRDYIVASSGAHESLLKRGELPVAGLLNGTRPNDAHNIHQIADLASEVGTESTPVLVAAHVASVLVAPLLDVGANRSGLLLIGDDRPRVWNDEEIELFAHFIAVTGDVVSRLRDAAKKHREMDESQAWLKRNFDDALGGHAVATAQGKILACNEEFARIIGFDRVEDALAANLHSVEPEPGAFMKLLERLEETPLISMEELRLVRHDGKPARVLAKLAATSDASGKITEVRVYLLDITQRFEKEEKLRVSDERFHLVELATQDVLWEWDLLTGRLEWNGAVSRRFRYTPEEVHASIDWFEERIHPEDRERVIRGLERVILGVDITWTDEYRFLRGDGTYATVLDRGHVVRNGRSEPTRAVGWMLDITERKAAEEMQRFLVKASGILEGALKVEVTAARLARLAVPALADFCMVDLAQPDGAVRRAAVAHTNPECEKLLNVGTIMSSGNGSEKIVPFNVVNNGISDSQAVSGGGKDEACAMSEMLGISAEADPRAFMCVPLATQGRVLGAATFVLTGNRRSFGPIEVLTARELVRRAGPALENSVQHEITHRAVNIRNEVLGIVSHDLRVPLSTIVAAVSLLEDSEPDNRQQIKHLHEIVRRATDQMTALVSDLLDATRMESEHFTIERSPVDPSELIAAACESLQTLAHAKTIALECTTEENPGLIDIDSPQILRVIGNLVSNAVKFSPAGSTIRVRGEVHGQELWISVQDSGEGISALQLPRVFDRFWTGRRSDRRGSGLGLSIAEGIVKAHGGRIWVESEAGQGSKFTLALPRESRAEPALAARRIAASIGNRRSTDGMKIAK